jgi:hypothetical protein
MRDPISPEDILSLPSYGADVAAGEKGRLIRRSSQRRDTELLDPFVIHMFNPSKAMH